MTMRQGLKISCAVVLAVALCHQPSAWAGSCLTDADCASDTSGSKCVNDLCGCATASDCASNDICNVGVCQAPCLSDSDCGSTWAVEGSAARETVSASPAVAATTRSAASATSARATPAFRATAAAATPIAPQ